MPRIYVEFDKLKQVGENCRTVSSKIEGIRSDFQRTMRQLDWDVKYEADINNTANQLAKKLDLYKETLKKYQEFMTDATVQYERLDNEKMNADQINISAIIGAESGSVVEAKNGILGVINNLLNDIKDDEDVISKLKTYLKAADKWGGSKESGVLKEALAYIEDLADFFTGDMKGWAGAAAVCNLANSSSDFWTKGYKYFQKVYDGLTDGFFGKAAQKNVAGIALIGNVVGLFGKFSSASDGVGKKSWQGITADYIDSGKKVGDIVKSVHDLKNVGKAASAARVGGLWTPASVYLSIAHGGVDMVEQLFKSHEKYYADGNWDLADTGATLIDVGVAGLHGIINTLTFGLDDLILDSVGLNSEKIADGIKDWSVETGQNIRRWLDDFKKDPGGTCIKTAVSGIHGIMGKLTFGLSDVVINAAGNATGV